MAGNNKATPSPEELLKKREADVTAKEKEFKTREADLEKREKAVSDKEAELAEKEKLSGTEMADLIQQYDELKEKHEALAASGSAAEEEITELDFEGEKYEFAPGAPQTINFGGQKFTRKEITENEEVLLQLIGGNSNLIRKIK